MGKAAAAHIDPPNCREDLIRKAAADSQASWYAFWWIDERAERLVAENNRGLTAQKIRDLAIDWILGGGNIKCVPEGREGYKDRRHFHYDITIQGVDGFPRGLYVYMELCSTDEDVPTVNLLNAHKP